MPPSPADGTVAYDQLWKKTRVLLERLGEALSQGAFFDDCLDLLVEQLSADRGLLLLFHEDGGTQVINARGRGRALDPHEREEISKTIVERARSGSVIFRPIDEALPNESMHALNIASALAVPLRPPAFRGARALPVAGVIYLDFRDRRRRIGPPEQELCEAAATVISAVLSPYERLQAAQENLRLLSARSRPAGPDLDELLRPESMAAIRREVATCIKGESPILILGESGTGKTQLACAIAEASRRAPVIRATMGGSDDLNTITSELFGHERGSFSGAMARRVGLVEHADGGTLIFDEILNLPPHAQQLLLDFTQFGTYRPLGHERREPKQARVRLISATNGDLDAAMTTGKFRQDLYYRVASVVLTLPPLRERRDDIPSLAEGLLRRLDPGRPLRLSVQLRRLLMSSELAWPGNVRQLESVITRARERALSDDPDASSLAPEHLTPRDLGVRQLNVPPPRAVHDPQAPLCAAFQVEPAELADSWARLSRERSELDRIEREVIEAALARVDGVVARAARELGVGRTSLISRCDTLGIGKPPKARRP